MSGQTGVILGTANQDRAHLVARQFSVEAPDGTEVSGVFSFGVNVANQPGKCMFGGHVVLPEGS